MKPAAIEKIYDEHASALFGFLRQLTRDSIEAEDLVQQLFHRLIVDPGRLEDVRDLRGWLLRSAHHLFVDACRSNAARRNREQATGDAGGIFSIEPDPDQEMYRKELEAALDTLPGEQRIVVHLKLWEQRTFLEIAEILNIPADTAASRFRYGIDKLRSRLRPFHEELFGTGNEKRTNQTTS